jgi:hypothetical protein
MLSKTEILVALTDYYKQGDLDFIQTVNNNTYSYKVDLQHQRKQHNLTTQENEQKTTR